MFNRGPGDQRGRLGLGLGNALDSQSQEAMQPLFQGTSGFAQTREQTTAELGMSAWGSKGATQARMPKISERVSAASRDYQGGQQVDLFSGVGESSGLNQRSDTGILSTAPLG